jgi:GNAT superfamily N-acetyltransferase
MALVIRKLTPPELHWANSRYEEVDFLPSPASDLIAVAEVHGAAAGLGRVTEVAQGIGELGGMYVFPEHRGTGLSKSLIQFLINESGLEALYCLPFENLYGLYEAVGFKACLPSALVPAKIVEKHAWCNAHYPEPVLLMRRISVRNII